MPRGPEPKKPRPAWSAALRARRVALDLRQEDIAARTEDAISQGTISDLERGKVDILNMTASRVNVLAAALDWTLEEMQEALGVRLVYPAVTPEYAAKVALEMFKNATGRYPKHEDETIAEALGERRSAADFTPNALGYKIPKQPLPPIPDPLIDAGIIYGDRPGMEGLKEYRWQRWMERMPHRRRPQTPEEWLSLYLDLRDKIDPPEPEE